MEPVEQVMRSPAVWVIAGVLVTLVIAIWVAVRVERALRMVRAAMDGPTRSVEVHGAEATRSVVRTDAADESVELTGAAEVREAVTRWIKSGQRLLGALGDVLTDYDRLQAETEAARRELARLRLDLTRLQAENERYLQERAEIAQTLSRVVNDVLLPERRERPDAALRS